MDSDQPTNHKDSANKQSAPSGKAEPSRAERTAFGVSCQARAYHLLCASKMELSAHQLHRMLKVTYRSA